MSNYCCSGDTKQTVGLPVTGLDQLPGYITLNIPGKEAVVLQYVQTVWEHEAQQLTLTVWSVPACSK